MQHARGRLPDPAHGYCTDDVARALFVDLLHAEEIGWAAVERSAWRSLSFLVTAFEPLSGRFRNFLGIDRRWLETIGSEDAHGRALLALGESVARAPDGRFREVAMGLFVRALPAARRLGALRARSSALLACDAALTGGMGGEVRRAHRDLNEQLRTTFERGRAPGWPWPEPVITYEAALPPRALIVAGSTTGDHRSVHLGMEALDWQIERLTAPSGGLSPVGNRGWWPRGGVRARFDQQPIEAATMLLAAGSAYEATGAACYRDTMEAAYGWFLGRNDVGVAVADPSRGACHDGLEPDGVNRNQGAESTLMWLIALERMRALQEEAGLAASSAARPAV